MDVDTVRMFEKLTEAMSGMTNAIVDLQERVSFLEIELSNIQVEETDK